MSYPTLAELKAELLDAVTIEYRNAKYVAYGHGVYPPDSVLAGRNRAISLGDFKTIFAAREAFPFACAVH